MEAKKNGGRYFLVCGAHRQKRTFLRRLYVKHTAIWSDKMQIAMYKSQADCSDMFTLSFNQFNKFCNALK